MDSQIVLRPQDLVVALKLAANPRRDFLLAELAQSMDMALSSVHAALSRAEKARLVSRASGSPRAQKVAVLEFAVHGARYAFPGQLGGLTRGLATAIGGPSLREHFELSLETPVWPDPTGPSRGTGLPPLYAGAPSAARSDPLLYDLLTLVDAIRIGAARERQMAADTLAERLS